MAFCKLLLALSLMSLLLSSAFGQQTRPLHLTEQHKCRLDRFSAVQPSQTIRSEGGTTELWDEEEEQFQCAGVAPMRNTLRPNALSLPNYHPTPRLVFIERGQGFIGITFPGCAATYHAHKQQYTYESTEAWEAKQKGSVRDLHQKVHRIRRGDIVAIPAGAAHWCYNDGNGDLVAVSINDLNYQSNQLDHKFRAFYLAGGVPKGEQQEEHSRETFQNIFRAFDSTLMAEAFNVPEEIVRQMQNDEQEGRGLSVIATEPMSFIRPDEEQEQEQEQGRRSSDSNGLEESFCTMSIRMNTEKMSETKADVYSRQAGRIFLVDGNKLPALKYIDMSAERGELYPNAMLSPDWGVVGHTVVYVTRGEGQIEVVEQSGRAVMNDRVKEGDMYVLPQYYAATAKAGEKGFEWVAFMTNGSPMWNPLAGYTSVMRAMPLQVLTNAYQISPDQARELKMNRGGQSFLLSPGRRQF